jgi:hypothetical protein
MTIRKLKAKGISVYFEKENIDTMDGKGELLITLMSSLAQEESRSISENVTWGQRKRFSDGQFSLGYSHFLGYDKGANGFPAINEREAETIKLIYRLFLEGQTPNGIAVKLTELGIATPSGKEKWSVSTVKSILTNEKYQGCALLQKTFTVDYLTKKMKVNMGEVPQYFVEGSHPAIIAPEVFEMVQLEMKRRQATPGYTGKNPFSAKLVCGDCGAFFGPKLWHSNDAHRRTIYQCNAKYKSGKQKCTTPHLAEDDIKSRFIAAVNSLITERDELLAAFNEIRETVFDTTELDAEFDALKTEITVVAELIQKCVDENAHTRIEQVEYSKRYDVLISKYDSFEARISEIREVRTDKKFREHQLTQFLAELSSQPNPITDSDERLWNTLLEKATVCSDGNVKFTFRDGTVV